LTSSDLNALCHGGIFKVGDPRIDAEHQQLFDLIAKAKEQDFDDVPDLLDQLKAYTRTHFSHEEALMARRRYPLLKEHQDFHRDLIDKLYLMSSSSLANDDQKEEVLALVQHWLKDHIFVHDQAYSKFFQEHPES